MTASKARSRRGHRRAFEEIRSGGHGTVPGVHFTLEGQGGRLVHVESETFEHNVAGRRGDDLSERGRVGNAEIADTGDAVPGWCGVDERVGVGHRRRFDEEGGGRQRQTKKNAHNTVFSSSQTCRVLSPCSTCQRNKSCPRPSFSHHKRRVSVVVGFTNTGHAGAVTLGRRAECDAVSLASEGGVSARLRRRCQRRCEIVALRVIQANQR